MNKLKFKQAIATILVSSAILTACVDDSYDLSDEIDMTVTLGGESLTIPGSSTDTITLAHIFDLDNESTLKTSDGSITSLRLGDYYINESTGDPRQSGITVDGATVNLKQGRITNEAVSFGTSGNTTSTLESLGTFIELESNEISGQLRSIKNVWINQQVNISIAYNSSDDVSKVILAKGVTIEFPDIVTLAENTTSYYISSENKITVIQDCPIYKGGKMVFETEITHIDLTDHQDAFTPSPDKDIDEGQFDMDVEIKVRGNIKLSEYKGSSESPQVTVMIAEIDFATADILAVEGVVAPDFDIEIDPVDFNSIPEFLNDDEANIDLSDPRIYLTIENTATLGMNIQAELRPLDSDGNVITDENGNDIVVNIGNSDYTADDALFIEPEETQDFEISRTGSSSDTSKGIEVADLNRLLYRIPTQIRVDVTQADVPAVDYYVELDKTYDVTTSYEILSPLSFGKDLYFVYRDTIADWQSDLEDLEITEVTATMNILNEIPMEMTLEGVAIDSDKNIIDNITVKINGTIAPGDLCNTSTAAISMTLISDGESFNRLDGIILKVNGVSTDESVGVVMNSQQTLKFTDVKLTIKGGITIDLN